ncbi:MAG: hypothetical protein RBS80_26860 [Thermoguttaceae bacterium]|jgi:hypothetical protein|nr:hypothetical protein [Thermoguttaceae bacterium]
MDEFSEQTLTYEWIEVLRERPIPATTTEGVERLKARGMRLYKGVYADVEEVLAVEVAEWRSAQDRIAKRLGYKSRRSLGRASEQKL